GLTAAEAELVGIAEAMGDAGLGVLQANSDFDDPIELELLHRMAEVSRRPLSFSLLQVDHAPERWRDLLTAVEKAAADGLEMRAQVASRPIGVLMGLQATLNPFLAHAGYRELATLPLPERVARLRRPEVRGAILAEDASEGFAAWMGQALQR